MKKESVLYGIAGLLAGILLMGLTANLAVNNQHEGMMRMMGMHTNEKPKDHNTMSMSGMVNELKDLQDDDFDKAFIEMMIAHHQGAIDMARLIPDQAKHDELKTLGTAIINAQTKEIEEMKQWQKDWGYTTDEMMEMMQGR